MNWRNEKAIPHHRCGGRIPYVECRHIFVHGLQTAKQGDLFSSIYPKKVFLYLEIRLSSLSLVVYQYHPNSST